MANGMFKKRGKPERDRRETGESTQSIEIRDLQSEPKILRLVKQLWHIFFLFFHHVFKIIF